MPFDAFREFLDPDLVLPIGGTGYRVESLTAREGLALRLLLLDGGPGDRNAELAHLSRILGDTLAQMRADGVKWPEIVHAGRTAVLHFGVSAEAAESHWNTEVAPDELVEQDLSLPGTYGPDDPGGGEYLPEFGIRAWYNDLSRAPSAKSGNELRATWPDILDAWAAVEIDFQDWGIDLESGVLDERSWRWMNQRIWALVASPASRLHRSLKAKAVNTKGEQGGVSRAA